MAPPVPDVGIDVPELSQVGFVVENLDDGMDRFGGVFGIDSWDVFRFEPPLLRETTYRGEPREYTMDVAAASVGGTIVELIQPRSGPNIYTDHLDDHGEGLHHVACFAFDDPEAVVESFADAGTPVLQSGRYGGMTYWYLDTAARTNGVIFETATNLEAMPDPDRTYPA
jgi:hypothetical protein